MKKLVLIAVMFVSSALCCENPVIKFDEYKKQLDNMAKQLNNALEKGGEELDEEVSGFAMLTRLALKTLEVKFAEKCDEIAAAVALLAESDNKALIAANIKVTLESLSIWLDAFEKMLNANIAFGGALEKLGAEYVAQSR